MVALYGFVVELLRNEKGKLMLITTAEMLPLWFTAWQLPVLVKLISCSAFWIAFDLVELRKLPNYMSNTFLIYAMHSLVGATL